MSVFCSGGGSLLAAPVFSSSFPSCSFVGCTIHASNWELFILIWCTNVTLAPYSYINTFYYITHIKRNDLVTHSWTYECVYSEGIYAQPDIPRNFYIASNVWLSAAITLWREVPSGGSVDIKRSKAVCFVTWRHFLVAPSQILCLDRAGRGGLTKTRRGTWIHYTWRPPTIKNHHHHHHLCRTSWQLKLEFAFIIVIWDMLWLQHRSLEM